METQEVKEYIKETAINKINEVIALGSKLKLSRSQSLLILQEVINK